MVCGLLSQKTLWCRRGIGLRVRRSGFLLPITVSSGCHVFIQLLSHVRLFATPWTAVHQASLSFTTSQSLLKLMSIELAMPSTISSSVTPFFSCPWSFPVSGSFPMSWLFVIRWPIGALPSASVLPMNIHGWFPLGLTGLIFLLSKGFLRVFSNIIVWKYQFFSN